MYMHEIRARTWDIYVRKVTKGLSLSLSLSTALEKGKGKGEWGEQGQ